MSQNANPIELETLLAPLSLEQFYKAHWPKMPFVIHEQNESKAALQALPFLESLDALLNSWPSQVQAHLPDVSDEANSIDASPRDAKKLFQSKMSLNFNLVEAISPFLANAVKTIQNDLGLPAMTYGRSMVYATPEGKGNAPHFDQNINFVLQLSGVKKWYLAPNEMVTSPSQRHTLGQAIDPELLSYLDSRPPGRMPDNKVEYILKPGSLLFVPQGYWHETLAETDALSLNFTYSQPSWVDIFTTALRSRLLLSPEWRVLADGVHSKDEKRRESARIKFDELLMELTLDLPNWSAHGILGATEGLD